MSSINNNIVIGQHRQLQPTLQTETTPMPAGGGTANEVGQATLKEIGHGHYAESASPLEGTHQVKDLSAEKTESTGKAALMHKTMEKTKSKAPLIFTVLAVTCIAASFGLAATGFGTPLAFGLIVAAAGLMALAGSSALTAAKNPQDETQKEEFDHGSYSTPPISHLVAENEVEEKEEEKSDEVDKKENEIPIDHSNVEKKNATIDGDKEEIKTRKRSGAVSLPNVQPSRVSKKEQEETDKIDLQGEVS